MKTREKIWRKSLQMFNEKGIEQVGVREIARELGISPGNLSYHFPQKEDIVFELGQQLKQLNDDTLQLPEEASMTLIEFFRQFEQTFRNQYAFRCLLISAVDIMRGELLEGYKKTAAFRKSTVRRQIIALGNNGSLDPERLAPEQINNLVELISLIARYWPSESRILYGDLSPDQQFSHFYGVMIRLFAPFASEQGSKEIAGVLGKLEGLEQIA